MPKNNIGRELIPFTIVNNSSADLLYLYMFGTTKPLEPKNNTYYLSDYKGDCTLFDREGVKKSYGLKLQRDTANNVFSVSFPQLDAVRVYISLGNPLLINTDQFGIPEAVSADSPSGPNYKDYWDFVEGTWHDYGSHTVLHMNTTQVDAFGLPFKIEHSGYDPSNPKKPLTIVGGFDSNKARINIINDLLAAGKPWKDLAIPVVGIPRILMPLKALDLGVFPKNQLDDYIAEVGRFYQHGTPLVFKYAGVNYTSVTIASHGFVFAPDKAKDDAGKATSEYSIPLPTTRQCYAQNIISSPDDGVGRAICAALGASFLRSTLKFYPDAGFPVPQEERSLYYAKSPICEYARIIHKYGIDNHAFCYGYDEVAGDAGPNRDVFNPTSLKLTLNALT